MDRKRLLAAVLAIAIVLIALWLLGPLRAVLGGNVVKFGNVTIRIDEVIAPTSWSPGEYKLEPDKTYLIVQTGIPTWDVDLKLRPDMPFRVELIVLKRGVKTGISLYCGGVAIASTFVGNITVLRWPLFENDKLAGEKLCIYINGTFMGCYIVKPVPVGEESKNTTILRLGGRPIAKVYPMDIDCAPDILPYVYFSQYKDTVLGIYLPGGVRGNYAILRFSYIG